MDRVLVTGAGGLLGRTVAERWRRRGIDVVAVDHAALDVADAASVRRAIESKAPSLVVHCAAMTDVDACQLDPPAAFAVNAWGCRNVAEAAARIGATVVAVSTDYVFDGERGVYEEGDVTGPIQLYGESKLAGEHAVRERCERYFIVRSAWIYGWGGKNFLSKLPELARGGEIAAVVDQFGSPTFAPDLADAIFDLVGTGRYGTYHVVNSGRCSFAEFCRYALEVARTRTRVREVTLASLGRPAPRPRDTSLASRAWTAAGLAPLRPWTEAAASFLTSGESA